MVLVLAWAIPQAGSAATATVAEVRADTAAMPAVAPSPDGKGTMTVSPTPVAAAQTDRRSQWPSETPGRGRR